MAFRHAKPGLPLDHERLPTVRRSRIRQHTTRAGPSAESVRPDETTDRVTFGSTSVARGGFVEHKRTARIL